MTSIGQADSMSDEKWDIYLSLQNFPIIAMKRYIYVNPILKIVNYNYIVKKM